MAPAVQVVLSGALTFGVPLLFALHELVTLGRRNPGPDDRDHRPAPLPPTPLPDGTAPPQRKLPDCLIPVLPPRGTQRSDADRVLEPA
jgi:hypothetical protein